MLGRSTEVFVIRVSKYPFSWRATISVARLYGSIKGRRVTAMAAAAAAAAVVAVAAAVVVAAETSMEKVSYFTSLLILLRHWIDFI